MKADKTNKSPMIDDLLVELGNEAKAIPFFAIFPGDGGRPIVHPGPLTQGKVLEMLEEAGPSKADSEDESEGDSADAESLAKSQ